jgi:hypothetical protein
LPPRREELLGQCWRNAESLRNIHIYHGLLAVLTGYHKIQHLAVRYLIYIPSLVNFIRDRMQQASPRAFLFPDQGDLPWHPDMLTRCLQRHTMLQMGCAANARQWRQIAVALDPRGDAGLCTHQYNKIPKTWLWILLNEGG